MPSRSKTTSAKDSTATIGFEAMLWLTADRQSTGKTAEGYRSNNMDAAEPSSAIQGSSNFVWVQHFIHLAPQGMASSVLANASMSSNQSGESDIRRALKN